MTTLTTSAAPARRGVVAGEPQARFADLVAAEWTKTWSLRSTRWTVPVVVALVIAINAFVVHSDFPYIDNPFHPSASWVGPGPDGKPFTPPKFDALIDDLGRIGSDMIMIVIGCLGAVSVFGEYATGQIRTTFAAVPSRGGVALAKVVVTTVVTTATGFAIAFGSFFITNAMLASRHVGLSINDPGCWRAVCAYALLAPVGALIGMMLAALIRHGSGTIVAVVVFMEIVPMFFGGDRYRILKEIGHFLPRLAWSRLAANPAGHEDFGKYPATITSSWTAYALWAGVSVIVTVLVMRKRDV